jgi:hypothetical protein
MAGYPLIGFGLSAGVRQVTTVGPFNSSSVSETGQPTMMTTSIRLHCETVEPPGP